MTGAEIVANKDRELQGDESGLVLYYRFNAADRDVQGVDVCVLGRSDIGNDGLLGEGADLVASTLVIQPTGGGPPPPPPPIGPIITTIAGSEPPGYSGDGGAATDAKLHAGVERLDVAVDSQGNVYIADVLNHAVRRVDAITGVISTIAGDGTPGYSGDGGLAIVARLNGKPGAFPALGVAVDDTDHLYIADYGNNRIRRIDDNGIITTVAGSGVRGLSGDGGPATSASMNEPFDLDIDEAGNLFIVDLRNHRIRRVDATTGIMTTVAGNSTAETDWGFSGDGGPATSAKMKYPSGVQLDRQGNVFIADSGNQRIRRVDAVTGIMTTVAGVDRGFSGDGGPAVAAFFNAPRTLFLDDADNIYIGDLNNNRIRLVDAVSGIVTSYAGIGTRGFSGDGGPAIQAEIGGPTGIAWRDGVLYIAGTDHRVCRVGTPTPPEPPNQSPVVDAGVDLLLECEDPSGTVVQLDGSDSSDPDEDVLSFLWSALGIVFDDPTLSNPTGAFPLGATEVSLAVSDPDGAADSDEITVTVLDTQPPLVSVDVDPGALWPPNHKYHNIDVSVLWSDACDDGVSVQATVVSNEPDDGKGNGDGRTTGDIRVSTATAVVVSSNQFPMVAFDPIADQLALRAERGGADRVK